MHLKNFSLLRDEDNDIILSPAYDLLSTKLLIPGDKEEIALSMNGKKSNLSKKDFDNFANKLLINEKSKEEIFKKFNNSFASMNEWILKSFLSDDMKIKYAQLVSDRFKVLFN